MGPTTEVSLTHDHRTHDVVVTVAQRGTDRELPTTAEALELIAQAEQQLHAGEVDTAELEPPTCANCGNDQVAEGTSRCTDCLAQLEAG